MHQSYLPPQWPCPPLAKAEAKRSPATWILPSDLPAIRGDFAVTTFDLTIDEAGHPVRCDVIISSKSAELDSAVCAAVVKRARFTPARGADGSAALYVRRDRVIWIPNAYGSNSWSNEPDIVVSTPTLKKRHRLVAEVLLQMGNDGSISNCLVARSSKDETLDKLACDAVSRPNLVTPIRGSDNASQAGVRSFFVGFQPGTALAVQIR